MDTTQTYENHTISLNRHMSFDISGKHEGALAAGGIESLRKAKELIDEHNRAKTREKRVAAKLAIPALIVAVTGESMRDRSFEVRRVKVKGIHASQGHVTFDPPADLDGNTSIYPDAPHVEKLLNDYAATKKALDNIEKEMRLYRVLNRRSHGRATAEQYDKLIASLVTDLEAAQKRADAQPAS